MPESTTTPNPFELGPPQPIDHVAFVHGWTLTPDSPAWYRNMASFVTKGFGIRTSVPEMPNTLEPVPGEWEAHIDEIVDNPASTILVTHSFGLINALYYIVNKKLDDPGFELGGLVSVAGNLSDVGFDTLKPHFSSDVGHFAVRMRLANLALRQVYLLYGGRDPYVSPDHGFLLARELDAPMIIDNEEAHFSGEYTNPLNGEYTPPCTFSAALAFILSKMIMNVRPNTGEPLSAEWRLTKHGLMVPRPNSPFVKPGTGVLMHLVG